MQQNTSREQSEFNEAFGMLNRVNSLWQKVHLERMAMNLMAYCDSLLAVYTELESDMKKDDSKQIMKSLLGIKLTLSAAHKSSRISQDHFDTLFDIEIRLRTVWDDAGYKTRRGDNPGTVMGK